MPTQCCDLMRARTLAQEVVISHTHTHTFVLNRRIYDEQEDEVISERMIEKDREKRNFIKAP